MYRSVSIKMIANELGLSVSAVSKALNGYSDISAKTKSIIVDKAMEMGYSPNVMARNLAKNTSNMIGVVIRGTNHIHGEYFKAINEIAREYNLLCILCDSKNDPELEYKYVKSMIDARVKGLLISPVSADISRIKELVDNRVPVIYFGERVQDTNENFVYSDGRNGIRDAISYLIGLGHKRIAFLYGGTVVETTRHKLRVYSEEMEKHGLESFTMGFKGGEIDLFDAGFSLGNDLLNAGLPYTAVICSKDNLALGVISALSAAGKSVPNDLSVIGYDGLGISAMPFVQLTTISHDKEQVAKNLIRILNSKDDSKGDSKPENLILETSLIIRKTCKAIT